jgi:hypothetical protein
MKFHDALKRTEELKCRLRVYTLLADTLAPYLDVDVGKSKALVADDCHLVRHVPKDLLYGVQDELLSVMQGDKGELENLMGFEVKEPRKAPKPRQKKVAASSKTTTEKKVDGRKKRTEKVPSSGKTRPKPRAVKAG